MAFEYCDVDNHRKGRCEMLPLLSVICGIICLFVPGMEIVSIAFFLAAVGMFIVDNRSQAADKEAQQVGYTMGGGKIADCCLLIFVVFLALVFLSVMLPKMK